MPKDGSCTHLLSHIASFRIAILSEWLSALVARKAENWNSGFYFGEAQLKSLENFPNTQEGCSKDTEQSVRILLYSFKQQTMLYKHPTKWNIMTKTQALQLGELGLQF